MSRRADWEKILERFTLDQKEIPTAWRAERPGSPAVTFVRALTRPGASPRMLMTGTIGNGKSTEMRRILDERATQDIVILLDLARHFDDVVHSSQALVQVSSWEVVFLVGLAAIRVAQEGAWLPHGMPSSFVEDLEKAWKLLAQDAKLETPAKLDVGKLAGSVAIVASTAAGGPVAGLLLGAAKAVADSVGWTLPIGGKKSPVRDQSAGPQTMLSTVNLLLNVLANQTGRRVVVLIDGLDRISDVERAREVVVDSDMISRLDCPLMVSGPFALRSHTAAAAISRFEWGVLDNVAVGNSHAPWETAPEGTAFFQEMFRKRTSDLTPPLFSDSLLSTLAYYSGGRARDFVKLLHTAAEEAWYFDLPEANEAVVATAIHRQRKQMEVGIDSRHLRIFEAIVADPAHNLTGDPEERELLANGHLLPYNGGAAWYFPHPLLTIYKVKVPRRAPGSSAS